MSELIDRIVAFYGRYSEADLADLDEIFHRDAEFRDPIHSLKGIEAISDYFESSRSGVVYCRFHFSKVIVKGPDMILEWRMDFAHRKLKRAAEINVEGCSSLLLDPSLTRVVEHRDYYDLGDMIYEHVPVLGSVTRGLKKRLATT